MNRTLQIRHCQRDFLDGIYYQEKKQSVRSQYIMAHLTTTITSYICVHISKRKLSHLYYNTSFMQIPTTVWLLLVYKEEAVSSRSFSHVERISNFCERPVQPLSITHSLTRLECETLILKNTDRGKISIPFNRKHTAWARSPKLQVKMLLFHSDFISKYKLFYYINSREKLNWKIMTIMLSSMICKWSKEHFFGTNKYT